VAVYVVEYAKRADGMKVAVVSLSVTVPDTAVAPADTRNVAVVTFFTASLKVAVMVVLVETPVAPFAGLVAVTAGGVLSRPCALADARLWSEARAHPEPARARMVTSNMMGNARVFMSDLL
jgi:hypothetical protein